MAETGETKKIMIAMAHPGLERQLGVNGVVLFSGGLDSAVVLAYAQRTVNKVTALCVSYGQSSPELNFAIQFCNRLGIDFRIAEIGGMFQGRVALTQDAELPTSDPKSEEQKVTVVPNRNGVLLMLGVAEAIMTGASRVYSGIQSGGRMLYPDNRLDYLECLTKAAFLANDEYPIELRHPFCGACKSEIVRVGSVLGVPFELTCSCYRRSVDNPFASQHCGVCKACQTRRAAFIEAGVEDPTEYEKP